jgi:predicted ATP-grasp superfamily ATP-dependent carboligase
MRHDGSQFGGQGMEKTILVCDGEQRSALAVARSLGRRGHTILTCSHEPTSLTAASRFVSNSFTVPSAAVDPNGFVKAVHVITGRYGVDVVVPMTDPSNSALLGVRSRFVPAVVLGPSKAAFDMASDKMALLEFARSLGVDVPDYMSVARPDQDLSPLDGMRGPFALKSAVHSARGRYMVRYATTPLNVRRQLLLMPRDAFPVLVQERVTGPGVGVFLLIRNGVTVAAFAHERVREQPPSGGSAVYARSIVLPDHLRETAERLLRGLEWEGVAMVEFKRCARTGRHYLMEINGRFWGSLQLAIDAGVDFPNLLLEPPERQPGDPLPAYAVGVCLRSFWRDLTHLLNRLRYSASSLDLPPQSRGRLGALVDFCRWSRKERSEVFRLDDPRPFLRESLDFLSLRVGARKRADTRVVARRALQKEKHPV